MPEHRHQGIGATLMRQAEDWARARGDFQIGLQDFRCPTSITAFAGICCLESSTCPNA
jgi:GNAT superfamily N-acetyltransferase